jgi:stage IV sporulation protein FB
MFLEATTLFVIILIHEIGHIWTALSYGWRVEEVQLLPFGGVAKVNEHGSTTAAEEMIVALAGPLNNGLMVWVAYFFSSLGWWGNEWTHFFIQANLFIALFNLLPVLPLDGGKVLQCLLSLRFPYHQAIKLSIVISLLTSLGLLIYGLGLPLVNQIHLNAIIISVFLMYTNAQLWVTTPVQHMRFLLHRNLWCRQVSLSGRKANPILASVDDTVYETLRRFRRGDYHLVYVLDNQGNVEGVLTEQTLLEAYLEEGLPRERLSRWL